MTVEEAYREGYKTGQFRLPERLLPKPSDIPQVIAFRQGYFDGLKAPLLVLRKTATR